jgi:hypothetical protein
VVITQLALVSRDANGDNTTAAKFLKIFDKVSGMIPLKFDAEIRIEMATKTFSRRHTACVQPAGMNIRRVCCSNRQQQAAKRTIGALLAYRRQTRIALRRRSRVALCK